MKYDGKFASRWRAKSPDALCAVLPMGFCCHGLLMELTLFQQHICCFRTGAHYFQLLQIVQICQNRRRNGFSFSDQKENSWEVHDQNDCPVIPDVQTVNIRMIHERIFQHLKTPAVTVLFQNTDSISYRRSWRSVRSIRNIRSTGRSGKTPACPAPKK